METIRNLIGGNRHPRAYAMRLQGCFEFCVTDQTARTGFQVAVRLSLKQSVCLEPQVELGNHDRRASRPGMALINNLADRHEVGPAGCGVAPYATSAHQLPSQSPEPVSIVWPELLFVHVLCAVHIHVHWCTSFLRQRVEVWLTQITT
ncbi:uncharacterized protein BDCG_05299 [Blastomyces dermatitidis ER-3]|uniref:Uncharacterized protein n=2 Tax=Ajellomyces dermatitidis TaxID=5039 RepID=F2TK27_AJEDA|nr:uncharacterized protein BDCG_05299 [Blastomyces dermatitidis ER-3]EEQ90179.2 hypothetical protein BDCG_05299 [Blastomyces dermatitidis ER-3]EGE83590.2 hypothetical protein BDDG_06534 [Blastomyces dermatitidis ATCC 18188]